MPTVTIDDIPVDVPEGATILDAATKAGIWIPALCHHPAVAPPATCRLCMVEIRDGDWSKLVASCIYPAADGIAIYTETERVHNVRRWVLEMLLASCPASPEIAALAERYGVDRTRFAVNDPDQTCPEINVIPI